MLVYAASFGTVYGSITQRLKALEAKVDRHNNVVERTLATAESLSAKSILLAAFMAIVQGWLCAGMSVYVNQIIKQYSKKD